MKRTIERLFKPIVMIMIVAAMLASCTANGKLRKPSAPPTPAGAPKPPLR